MHDDETAEDASFLVLALSALAIVLGSCAPALYTDPGPWAFASNDTTALLSGCGEQAAVGHLYCRFPEGWQPSGELVVVVPPVECGDPECAAISVFGPAGQLAWSGGVKARHTYATIPWTALVGTGPLRKEQRGFWPVVVRWRWRDDNGLEVNTVLEGEVRLRVFANDYMPLGQADDATWRWKTGGVEFHATDRGRTAVVR